MRQAVRHKYIKMKITEKVQRRLRNVLITLTTICLTPLCEMVSPLSGAQPANAFAGQDLICAIDLGNEMYSSNGLETGLNYRLVNIFAADNNCNITVLTSRKNSDYCDSLRKGKIDLLITDKAGIEDMEVLFSIDDKSSWVMNSSDPRKIRQIDSWLAMMKDSDYHNRLQRQFSLSNPYKRADKGIITSTVSPYDDIIKKYAKSLGWDWRMIAAVIYQESKFSIGSSSPRGAQGLMQVMPQTGCSYGVDNLLDPEQNIIAGTNHLKRLQNIFSKYDLDHDELVKFTLAAYNAGEGRILDCRNLAQSKGYDSNKWDNILKIIPLMRDDSILEDESVKLGKFQGHETIAYINNVMSHYETICQICPTSL